MQNHEKLKERFKKNLGIYADKYGTTWNGGGVNSIKKVSSYHVLLQRHQKFFNPLGRDVIINYGIENMETPWSN